MKHVRKYRLVPVNETEESTPSVQTGGEVKKPEPQPETKPSPEATPETKPETKPEIPSTTDKKFRLPPPGEPTETISKEDQEKWQTGSGEKGVEKPSSSPVESSPKRKPKSTKNPRKPKTRVKKMPKWQSL